MRKGSIILSAWLVAILLLWAGCSSPSTSLEVKTTDAPAMEASAAEAKEKKKEKEDAATKREGLMRKLAVTEIRLQHAQLELKIHEENAQSSLAHAEKELVLAKDKLTQFQTLDKPNRIARKELDLQRSRDAAQEAQEELEQLEIMYKEQDLEDMTREFVISRGKRRAEQRNRSLKIQETEFKSFMTHELVREEKKLHLEAAKKEQALAKLQLSQKAALLQKKMSIMNVENELADLKEKLANLAEKK